MAIRRWHWGKLVILWAWGGLLTAFELHLLETIEGRLIVETLLIVSIVGVPVALTVVTWKWLTRKELRDD